MPQQVLKKFLLYRRLAPLARKKGGDRSFPDSVFSFSKERFLIKAAQGPAAQVLVVSSAVVVAERLEKRGGVWVGARLPAVAVLSPMWLPVVPAGPGQRFSRILLPCAEPASY